MLCSLSVRCFETVTGLRCFYIQYKDCFEPCFFDFFFFLDSPPPFTYLLWQLLCFKNTPPSCFYVIRTCHLSPLPTINHRTNSRPYSKGINILLIFMTLYYRFLNCLSKQKELLADEGKLTFATIATLVNYFAPHLKNSLL